jgi:hypothetical protein
LFVWVGVLLVYERCGPLAMYSFSLVSASPARRTRALL